MKHITILRHGQATQDAGFEDFDRPLTDKGRKHLPRMAAFVAHAKVKPDWIVSSPAQRAKETAEIVSEALHFTRPIVSTQRAYLASAVTLLEILRETPDVAEHLIVVGHNPGMSDLVAGLCAGGDFRLNIQMPTGGLATLAAQVMHWRQLRWGCAELLAYVSPQAIKGLQE